MDRYKKSLGQNFLTDKNIIHKLLSHVPNNIDIIEIGTGSGNLTIELANHTTNNIKSYEVDTMAYEEAAERLVDFKHVELILEDFLQAEVTPDNKCIVVANIPYYITSPIIEKCLNIPNVMDIYIMIQKEMAERVIAVPSIKNYSSFSIFCQTRAECKKLFNVANTCFTPAPKVDSAYIKLTPTTKYLSQINNLDIYNKIVRNSFWGKRKTLMNCLVKGPYIKFRKEDLIPTFQQLGLIETIRGQQLSVEQFIKLANAII